MAVNQALIESARRMYAAEHGVVDKSGIVQGIASAATSVAGAFVQIKKEAEAQREKNKNNWKSRASTPDKIKEDPEALKKYTDAFEKWHDLYDEGSKESTRGFNKEARAKGVEKMNKAMAAIDAIKMDLELIDQTRSYYDNLSAANTTKDLIGDNMINSPDAAKNLQFNPEGYPAGVYIEDLSEMLGEDGKPKLVRLSELKPLVRKWDEGIKTSGDLFTNVANSTKKDWNSQLKGEATGIVNELINNPNFSSLLFDDINDFNFAKEHLRSEGVDMEDEDAVELAMEGLRQEYKENPNKLKNEWKSSVLAALEEDHKDAIEANEADEQLGGKGPYSWQLKEIADQKKLEENLDDLKNPNVLVKEIKHNVYVHRIGDKFHVNNSVQNTYDEPVHKKLLKTYEQVRAIYLSGVPPTTDTSTEQEWQGVPFRTSNEESKKQLPIIN